MTPKLDLPYRFDEPICTSRLRLRTMRPEDVDDIHAYQSSEDVCRYLPFEPRARHEVAEKVAKYSGALVLCADGDYWQLALQRLSDPDGVIGDVYFCLASIANATGEIGWTLHPSHARNGYMTEAAGAVLDIAFSAIGLHRVFARLDPRNLRSIALCKRLGMHKEAHFAQDIWFKGEWGDTEVFAILDHEWMSGRLRAEDESVVQPAVPGSAPSAKT